jgi:hypothetical protein
MGTPSDSGGAAAPRDLEVTAIHAGHLGGSGVAVHRSNTRPGVLCPSLGFDDLEAYLA